MIDLELIEIGETREVDGPSFIAHVEHPRDRTWHVARGSKDSGRRLATIERPGVLTWMVTSPADADAVLRFGSSEKAIRHSLTRS